PYDAKSYAFGGIYQFFGKTVVLSGYDGTDRLLACTGFHLTGQLAILKCRVKEFLKNNHDTHGFNDSTTSSYQILSVRIPLFYANLRLTSLTELERIHRFTFLIYVCILSCTLYGHCYIGECLIEELINRILIDLQFDELSTINLKFLCICMVRARKPLRLTCAKFRVVSLCTFTDIVLEYYYSITYIEENCERCIGYVCSTRYNRVGIPYFFQIKSLIIRRQVKIINTENSKQWDFKAGDMVFVENDKKLNRKKLDELKIGPYKILQELSHFIYKIETDNDIRETLKSKRLKRNMTEVKETKTTDKFLSTSPEPRNRI
ncbi:odorant receptor 13a-like, partial [Vespula squamosa]